MSAFVDEQYVNRVSFHLRNFKRKNGVWNFSCPICGDSKKHATKARGYFIRQDDRINFKCHNCGDSSSLGNFLKLLFPELYRQYSMDKWANGGRKKTEHHVKDPYKGFKEKQTEFFVDQFFTRVSALGLEHTCVKYLDSRQIPRENYERLFYCEDVSVIEKIFPRYKDKIHFTEARLIIPCYNNEQVLLGIQARALDPDNPKRYLTFRENDQYEFVFGLDKFDKRFKHFVVEGPIDSLFLPNCLAACTSTLLKLKEFVDASNCTYVFDNQPRNREVVQQVWKAVEARAQVFFWPTDIEWKDLNDLVVKGRYPQDQLVEFINKHTYQGLAAHAQFQKWNKVDLSDPRKKGKV